ncbi:MAG TPA: AraC family transcriptional regulator [Bacteroidia bacterium]
MQTSYLLRINKVFTYIDSNLDGELTLNVLADVACYSPFHLHRLFKCIANETLNNYIIRKRIERSALLLIHNPEFSITEISEKYGFNSTSVYSRTFKNFYGISPTEFRKTKPVQLSKIGQVNSKIGQVDHISKDYICNIKLSNDWLKMNAKIEIKKIPEMQLVYITHIGDKGIEEAFNSVLKQAIPKDYLSIENTHICRVFHDSFKITDAEKVRMSIGVISPKALPHDQFFSNTSFDPGKCLVGYFEISIEDFEKAWDSMFLWMSEKGYKRSEQTPLEIYLNKKIEIPNNKLSVELCIPIE